MARGGGTMAKSKAVQDRQDIDLAPIWPDPPVESIGTTARSIPGARYREELARLQVELVKCQEWVPPRQSDHGYVRPPKTDQTFIPEVF